MKHSTGKPTKAAIARWVRFPAIGCLAARQRGFYQLPEVHHLLSGGRRRGHLQTIPLSPWSHRGVPPFGMSAAEAEAAFGPSLARNPRAFHDEFGTDDQLLALTDQRVEEAEKQVVR